jgi:tRNA(fMet)-specific endonuclease VapC
MSVLLDTAVLFAALGDSPGALAAVTASELLHGVERARDAVVQVRRSAFVEGVLENVPVIPFGLAEARTHARIRAELAGVGALIGAHDLQIAATAVVAGSEVATLNVTEFGCVRGLPLAELATFLRAWGERAILLAAQLQRRPELTIPITISPALSGRNVVASGSVSDVSRHR